MTAKAPLLRLFPGLLVAIALAFVPGCGGGGSDEPAKTTSSSSSGGTSQLSTLEVNKTAVQGMFARGQRALGLGGTPLVALGIAYPTRDQARRALETQTAAVQDMVLEVRVPGGVLSGTVTGTTAQYTAQVSGDLQVGPSAVQSATVRVEHSNTGDKVTYTQGTANLTITMQGGVTTASGTFTTGTEQWTLTELQQTVTRAQPQTRQTTTLAKVTVASKITSDRGERIQWSLDSTPQADGTLSQVTQATYTQANGASITSTETLNLVPVPAGSTNPPKPNGKITFEGTTDGKALRAEVAVENGQPTTGDVFEGTTKIGQVAFVDGKWQFRAVDAAGTAATSVAFDVQLDTEILASSMAAVF